MQPTQPTQPARMPPALEEELFGGRSTSRREPDRVAWIWVVYAALLALTVPWYLPADPSPPVWLGLPRWVVLSLGAVVATALFTAVVVRCCWSAEPPPSEPDGPAEGER